MHRFYLESANTVSLESVTRLLRSIFEEVVELGRSFKREPSDSSRASSGGGGGGGCGGGSGGGSEAGS